MFEEIDGIKYFYSPKDFYHYVQNYGGELILKKGMIIVDKKTKKTIGKLIKKDKNKLI